MYRFDPGWDLWGCLHPAEWHILTIEPRPFSVPRLEDVPTAIGESYRRAMRELEPRGT